MLCVSKTAEVYRQLTLCAGGVMYSPVIIV